MLKYQLNVNNIRNDLVPIELSDYSVEPMLGDNYKDQLLLVCSMDNEITFGIDARITAMYEQYMVNDDFISSTAYDFNPVFYPSGINNENRTFSIIFDKYFELSVYKTSIVTEDENTKWWYIWFNGSHLFDVSDGSTYTLYVSHNGPNGYNIDNPDKFTINTETYVTSSILRFPYEDLHDLSSLENAIFYEEDGRQVYDLTNVKFFRDNFIFTTGMFSLFLDKPMATVSLPLFQKNSTDLYEDNAIREKFTEVELKKSINKVVEMEKDIYHPVIWETTDNKNYGSIKNEVYKIKFNLHFRAHRGDDWIAEPNTYWNGVDSKNVSNLQFIPGYFTYDKEEKQSDLLTYLNFTDKDVRYQKNKLKKSFLRVMFFDSMSPSNQNMLAYYTIFLDSGEYFSKYARYIETEGYRKIFKDPDEEGTYTVKENLIGIKVDREPTKTPKMKAINSSTDIDDIEAVRLSSQLVVEDKYMSDASSEGFYLYLWKDNFLGTIPQNIYMKVEFNHAGFGRTIPFMCPFRDPNKEEGNGFKSFQDILKDWSVSEENYGTNRDTRYGIRKYLKYSYIHFKYKYDNISKRHVYYLDDEFYGTNLSEGGVHFDDNAITINLYEAKII